jgi:hypothetical protein
MVEFPDFEDSANYVVLMRPPLNNNADFDRPVTTDE